MLRLFHPIAVVCCFLCAQTAFALDPLLVEFGWSQPNPVTLPANYITLVDSSDWDSSNSNTITVYPTTQFADSFAVSYWNKNCADGSSCGIQLSNGGQEPFQFGGQANLDQILGGPNRLWADGWDGNPQPYPNSVGAWHAATYVPQLGGPNKALFGYLITAVERQITPDTETIRVYGVNAPVPEPSSWLLGLLGGVIHLSGRFPRRNPSSRRFRC
jgi:hypothetical protein